MPQIRVDLYSDTQTRPTPPMRRAIAEAAVGDEQRGEDPSVNRLCARVAELLGKEEAVFLPSGTMANEIAILVHCRPGDEIIADRTAHVREFEGGGPAALAGALVHPLDGEAGVFTAAQLEAAIREDSRYAPRSRLVSVEQTSNLGGGTVWPLAAIREVAGVARRHGLRLHMDGARLMNAAVASGIAAAAFAVPFDSAWIDLSKGLGCPAGAVLAGPRDFIAEAWRWKQRIGGALRQAGILAAAGLYALDHHVARLAEDHDNARHFARLVAAVEGIAVEPARIETNIVFLDVEGTGLAAAEVAAALEARGVRVGALGRYRVRAVTHLDIDRAGVEEAAAALRAVIAERGGRRRPAKGGGG